jgi:hypothetical protein
VTLNEDLVTAGNMVLALEKVVETNLVKRSRGRERGNVATDSDTGPLGPVHKHGRVPAHPGSIGSLNLLIARKIWFRLSRQGVYVVGVL